MILKNGVFLNDAFHFEKGDIAFSGEEIEKIGKADLSDRTDETVLDCTDRYIVPGLVDIHTHGCTGVDFSSARDTKDIEKMTRYYAARGTTTVLATTETLSREKTLSAVERIAKAAHEKIDGANIDGIHLEGPYFCAKYKGAQNEAHLRNPDTDEVKKLNEACGYTIRRISVAPELDGAIEFIRTLSPEMSLSLGHTDADYETAIRAFEAGADSLTHTFNAMRPLHHRNPNAVGAGLEKQVFCECIGDGFHLSFAVLTLLYRMLGDEHMLFVSDSLSSCGMPDGEYTLGELPVYVRDGKARLADGTIAGSTVTMLECAQNAIAHYGIAPESAFRMASLTPARAARIDSHCGSITCGKRADLLILKKDYSLDKVILRGNLFDGKVL